MNIFYLDHNPKICASYHHDTHVIKMILESAQILSGALFNILGLTKYYRPTHLRHPCVLWAGSSREHFEWLLDLLGSLIDEYSFRYSKTHKTSEIYRALKDDGAWLNIPSNGWSSPPPCMPDEFKGLCPIESYRKYYREAKQINKNGKFIAIYTNRQTPDFLKDLK